MRIKLVTVIMSVLMVGFLAACTEEAHGANLWQGAKVGMSVDDVLELFPAAVEIANDDPTRVTRGEELERVRIAPYDIGGLPFKVSMLFEDGKLAMVKEIAEAAGDDFNYAKAFKGARRVLIETYGAPYTEVDIFMISGAVWYLDKVDVNLAMRKRSDKPYDVDVTYSPAKSDSIPR